MFAKIAAALVALSVVVYVASRDAAARQRELLEAAALPDGSTPPRAGFLIRLAAKLADSLLLWAFAACALIVGAAAEAAGAPTWIWLLALAAPTAFFVAYFARATARTGQTWGKHLAGIKVQRRDGALLSRDAAVGRALLDGVFLLLARFAVGAVDFLWVLGKQRRALHDLATRSTVVWVAPPSRRLPLVAALGVLAPLVLVSGLVRATAMAAYFIPSEAMAPTLLPGDRIVANRLAYRLGPLQRGDVVVFHAPPQAREVGEPPKDFVKRVIGLPGDTVMIREGDGVFVNGQRFREAPGVPVAAYDWPTDDYGRSAPRAYKVPPGHCFVLGDNRNQSNDSHRWLDPETRRPRPELPLSLIVGKATFRFYPDSRVGVVR